MIDELTLDRMKKLAKTDPVMLDFLEKAEMYFFLASPSEEIRAIKAKQKESKDLREMLRTCMRTRSI